MSTQAHAERDHATWSASATDRNWNCPGALALTKDLPETTNEAADWGTCCHEIAEKCLVNGVDAVDFIGNQVKGKQYEFEVDDEMAETAQTYVDYVRQRYVAAGQGAKMLVEQKFSLASLKPPFEAGGTCDAIIYSPLESIIEVIDLKGGRGVVVDATGNKQLRTYALGAMLANPQWPVSQITVTIVQPRAPHKDGRIRSETFHVTDLIEWTADLLGAMERSNNALVDLQYPEQINRAAWNAKYLSAGAHCKFCKAAATCGALEAKATEAAGLFFDDLDKPVISIKPESLSADELAKKLDSFDMISDWMNAVRAYAHSQAEGGLTIPGYQLVEKTGNRAWKVEEAVVVARLKLLGVEDPYNKKLITPAQADKALKKRKGEIEDINERPNKGTNLVAIDKTSRPAVASAAERHFDVLN